jgi:MFS family permease
MLRSAHGRAVAIAFAASGIVTGTLSSRWPWIAARLHLTSVLVGAMGLACTAGALAAMPFAARFVHRFGTKAATVALTVALGVTLVFPPVAPTAVVLAVIMVAMGAAAGTQDTAINTAGVETEKHLGRSIMSGLHGMWSVGVLAGALIGSVAARENIDPRIQFPVMGAVIIIGGLSAIGWLKSESAADGEDDVHVPMFVWPRGLVLLIGLVAFAAIFVEFAASAWASLYMHWTMHTSQAEAALTTAMFALAMAAGRLSGDAVVRWTGPVPAVRACGLLAIAGCLLVAVAPTAWAAIAGFILIGLGVSVVVPLVFAAAGHSGPSPAMGVAGAATVSYGAGLAAPSVMGGIADVASLRVSFAATALLAAGMLAGAGLLRRPAAQPRETVVAAQRAES